MDKALNLHLLRYVPADFLYLFQGELPGCDNSPGPLLPPEIKGPVIGVVGLGADVPLDFRAHLLCDLKDRRVGDDEGVRLHFPQLLKIFPHTGKVAVVGQDVGRHMDPHAVVVGKADALRHVLPGKIFRLGPQAEGLAAYIHCVRAEDHSGLQHLQAAGRDEQFRMSVHSVFPFFTLTASPSPRGRILVRSRSSCFNW